MKIEDYLKYHIGQKVKTPDCIGLLTGLDHAKADPTLGFIGGNVIYPDGKEYVQNFAQIKPILRPLSDMTEEEAIEVAALSEWEGHFNDVKVEKTKYGDLLVKWQGCVEGGEQFNATGDMFYCAEQFHYLLSRGFDLFGLIDAGLAIPSTQPATINNK